MKRLIAMSLFILLCCIFFSAPQTFGVAYSSGSYGVCTYNTCSIGLSSSGTVALTIVPSVSGTTCSLQSDQVTATTGADTGYTVTMTDNDTTNTLVSAGGATLNAVSGTSTSPVALSANTWGYRIDSIATFGAGPTSAFTNGTIPTSTFAAVPLSSDTPGTVRSTSTADSGTVSTPVWYGVCANTSTASGTYTDSIVYTALVNN